MVKRVNYKKFPLNRHGTPNRDSMAFLMLKIASTKSFWASKDLRNSCAKHIIMPKKLMKQRAQGRNHNQTQLFYDLRWTLTYLYDNQMLNRLARSEYGITTLGNRALFICHDFPSLQKFIANDSKQPASRHQKKIRNDTDKIDDIYKDIDNEFYRLNEKLKNKLLHVIRGNNPYFFERLVVILLSKMGYKGAHGLAEQTQKSRDGGIDGVIKKDPLGTSTIYIQAKRYRKNDKVNKNDIKNFYVSVKDRHSFRGVFITTSSFNSGAKQEAKRHSIILIDGRELANLMMKYNVGVQTYKSYKISHIDKDFFPNL